MKLRRLQDAVRSLLERRDGLEPEYYRRTKARLDDEIRVATQDIMDLVQRIHGTDSVTSQEAARAHRSLRKRRQL
jgi:hypothetical protein